MNLSTKTFAVLALLVTGFIIGCGGGGGGSSTAGTVSGPEVKTAADLFPDVDELDLLAHPPKTTVKTLANNGTLHTVPTEGDKVQLAGSDAISSAIDGSDVIVKSRPDLNASRIGQPLFFDGIFYGMITRVVPNGNDTLLGLKDAEKFSDVYSSFDITVKNDTIATTMQRSIDNGAIKGKYDSINTSPLQISVIKKPVTNARGLTNEEVVLRIDIPEGYKVPYEPRGIDCSFSDLECTLTVKAGLDKKIGLDVTKEAGTLTFSTAGSYIEIGIGAYLRAHYDYNLLSRDTLDFDLAQSAYFKANLTATDSGELKKEWSTTLDLIGSLNIEIVHPYSAVAKTSVIVKPVIVLGVDGKISGNIGITSYLERSGEVRFSFDSRDLSHNISHSIAYTPKDADKDSVTIGIEADANAYVFPAIITLPSLKFARIGPVISLVFLRSGIKLNNNINGKIESGFVVENNGEMQNSTAMEASLTTSLEGIVQGKWYVRLGALQADSQKFVLDLYHSDDYSDIFTTGKLNILEWKAMLLNNPTIEVEETTFDFNKRKISFDLDIDEKLKPKLYFYYTTDGSDINVKGIEKHKPVWRWTDAPFEVDKNTKIKVRAVLFNKDVSTSIWAWGTSISAQSEKLITEVNEPWVTPSSGKAFTDTLTVTITQDQGFDIFYQKNGSASVKYSGPIDLDEDTTLVVYARTEIDGQKFYSQKRTYKYDKCESDEKLEGGVCVQEESSSSSSDSSVPSAGINVIDLFAENIAYFDNLYTPYIGICPEKEPDGVASGASYIIELNTGKLYCDYLSSNGTLEHYSMYKEDGTVISVRLVPGGGMNITYSIKGSYDVDSASLTNVVNQRGEYESFKREITDSSSQHPVYSLRINNLNDPDYLYYYVVKKEKDRLDFSVVYDHDGTQIQYCKYNDDKFQVYDWCVPDL